MTSEYFEFKLNPNMEYRRLGRSGLRVSCLSLGGWLTIGGTVKGDPVRDIIKCAWENGVNFIDTAEGYADGQSEREIGRCIKELNIRRSDLVVSTKVFWGHGESPNSIGLSRKHIIEALDASLERLQMNYVDVYFAHRPDPTVPMEEVVRAFNWCIEQGKAHYWGTSEWSALEIEEAHHICSKLGLISPIAEQAEHSLMKRERAEGEYQPIYERYGTQLTVFSALHCGFLTGKYNDGVPADSRFAVHTEMDWLQDRVKRLSSPEGQKDIQKVRDLTEVAKGLDVSVTQLSLAYILKMNSTGSIIMGCKTPEQMLEQLGALDALKKIDSSVEEKVETIFANKPRPPRSVFVKFVAQGRGRSLNNLLPTTSHHFYKNKMPRRLTDRSLPHGLSAISPDVGLFDELMEMEKRLDWTMTRRRQEMTDVLNRGTLQTRRTLRIFLSHTVRNQAWQKSAEDDDSQVPNEEAGDGEEAKAAMETAQGVPSWTFKLEGKLLDSDAAPTPKRWPTPERKFSHMLKGVSIEMDRDPNVYADTNHVQWTSNPQWNNYNNLGQFPTGPNPVSTTETAPPSLPAGTVPVDGLTVTRLGDAPTALRLTLHLNHTPDRLKVSPQLASIISVYEDTKPNILGAFWHYVKANGLQDKNDRKLIRLDERLRGVFKYETLNFQDIPALLISGQHMAPADPIVLRYELGTHCIETATGGDVDMTSGTGVAAPLPGGIGVDKNGESAITAYDLSLDMDDLWMRSKAADIIMNMQPDSMSHGSTSTAPNSGSFVAIQKADDEIKQRLQNLRNLRMRRDFFAGLANEPSAFIQKFVQSQSRDLEVVLGNERAAEGGGSGGNLGKFGVHETDLVKSEFFHRDWAYEAVGVHEALRMGNAVAMFHHMALSQQQQQQQQAQHGPPPNMGAMPPPPGGMQMR